MASEGGCRNRMKGGQLTNPKLPSLAATKQFTSAGSPSPLILSGLGDRAGLRLIVAHLGRHRDSKVVPGAHF